MGALPTILATRAGRQVALGAELGRGAEGAVFEVVGSADLVGKVYLAPVGQHHAAKISSMVDGRAPAIEEFTAWPVDELLLSGHLRGFLMRRVPISFRPIHTLYGPKSRAVDFPGATWAFLGHVAMNLCRAFAAVHAAGHVIGDVNHDNVRVDAKGIVRLIDCDSFQIGSHGRRFRCCVGVSTYTPPELQGVQLDGVDRLPEHDAFGLAVMIFQLLLMGRHPFSGRFAGAGDMPIERAISEYRFPYSPTSAASGMQPPPNAIGLNALPLQVAALFRRAFERGRPQDRPLPAEWLSGLEAFRVALTRCDTNPLHYFLSNNQRCPWCEIETRVGVSLFGVAFFSSPSTGRFALAEYEDRLYPLRAVLTITAMPRPQSRIVVQPPEYAASALEWRAMRSAAEESVRRWTTAVSARRQFGVILQWPGRIAVGVVVIPLFWLPMFAGLVAHPGIVCGVLLFSALTFVLGVRMEQAVPGSPPTPPSPPPLVRAAMEELARADQLYTQLASTWLALNTGSASSTVGKAQSLCDEYKSLPQIRERRLAELSRTARDRQLHQFLASNRIERASIAGIGPSRLATLRSYGIETAADIDTRVIQRIDGFGDSLTSRLRWWRDSLEKNFRFDPGRSLSPSDLSALDADIAKARSRLAGEIQAAVLLAEEERKAAELRLPVVNTALTSAAASLVTARGMAAGMGP